MFRGNFVADAEIFEPDSETRVYNGFDFWECHLSQITFTLHAHTNHEGAGTDSLAVGWHLAQCPTMAMTTTRFYQLSVLDDLTVFLWHMFAVEDIHAVPSGWPSIGMPRVRVNSYASEQQ
ncbi:hypothetical protein E4U23_000805 [Claviceps purpurea]|nr:hypothetical protein E4U23_000805 [Claviceps purpurea]KAG6305453.1 hypothetical protein E4U45_000262 [Claviceps purpurea]